MERTRVGAIVDGGFPRAKGIVETLYAALMVEPTIKRAAERAGVAEVTIWRWMQQPAFQSRYREVRRQVVENAVATSLEALEQVQQAPLRVVP